jgi:hypothetical protein
MSEAALIQLESAPFVINMDAGDDVDIPFAVEATDTTGWTCEFLIYLSNDTKSGPSGSSIGSGAVSNTPNTLGGDSMLTVSLAGDVTSAYQSRTLWARFRKTNTGSQRTLGTGPINLK